MTSKNCRVIGWLYARIVTVRGNYDLWRAYVISTDVKRKVHAHAAPFDVAQAVARVALSEHDLSLAVLLLFHPEPLALILPQWPI